MPTDKIIALPCMVDECGRNPAEKFVLKVLHFRGPPVMLPLSEIAASKRASGGHLLHFSQIMSACSGLHKRGLLLHSTTDRGDCYALVPHTHISQ